MREPWGAGIVQISGTGAITLSIDATGRIERTAGWVIFLMMRAVAMILAFAH